MSKQLTTTMPDKLFKRLQAVKANFNVSRIAQKAIAREVTIWELRGDQQEQKARGADQRDTLIARLRLERQEYGERYRVMGFEDGFGHGLELSFAEIIEAIKADPRSVHRCAGCSSVVKQTADREEEAKQAGQSFVSDSYLRGWLEGLKAMYSKIHDELRPVLK